MDDTPAPPDRLAGRAMWVCLGWYVGVAAAYLLVALTMSDEPTDPDCGTLFCDVTPRDFMLAAGAVLACPLLMSFVLSAVIVTWWARRRGGGAGWIGFGGTVGGLLLGFGATIAAVAANAWL